MLSLMGKAGKWNKGNILEKEIRAVVHYFILRNDSDATRAESITTHPQYLLLEQLFYLPNDSRGFGKTRGDGTFKR